MRNVLLACVALAASAAALARDYPATECDRLAANPEDQDVIAPPVPRASVDLPRAIAACEAEVALHPDNVRARYQLSRVLAYDGQGARANAEMKRAADEGYRQAQFVYGLLIDRHRPGAPADPCLIESYWLRSARAGREAARVSYVRHVLNGRFDACRIQATPAEMQGFLEAATRDSGDTRLGVSTRGTIAMVRAARVWAAAHGRNHVLPDDIKELAAPVWTHRLVLAPEAEFAGVTAEGVLAKALSTTQPPMATGSR